MKCHLLDMEVTRLLRSWIFFTCGYLHVMESVILEGMGEGPWLMDSSSHFSLGVCSKCMHVSGHMGVEVCV